MVEQFPLKEKVGGPNPPRLTKYLKFKHGLLDFMT